MQFLSFDSTLNSHLVRSCSKKIILPFFPFKISSKHISLKMAAITGTYEMVSTDKYDEFLKAVGVSMINRTLASKAKPTMTWIEESGKWTQKTKTAIKSFEIVFTLGDEFEEVLADGRKCQSVITIEGNKLIHRQKMGDYSSEITREFNGNEMVSTFKAGDAVATRVFKKIA